MMVTKTILYVLRYIIRVHLYCMYACLSLGSFVIWCTKDDDRWPGEVRITRLYGALLSLFRSLSAATTTAAF